MQQGKKPAGKHIDLNSFYASAECMERVLDSLTTHLVVDDTSRTEKIICLAVSPLFKAYDISGRTRYFDAIQKVYASNALHMKNIYECLLLYMVIFCIIRILK